MVKQSMKGPRRADLIGPPPPNNTSGLAPVSIGAMLSAMVYTGGPTSGGHYNPAP